MVFDKEFRKQLIEQKWLSIQNSDSNPSQFWRRKRDTSLRAIRDLALLSDKLPMEKRNEIFSYDNMRPLVESITKTELEEGTGEIKYPKMELVSFLIKQSIGIIIQKYKKMNSDSPYLSQITIDHLTRASGICEDIANIIRNKELEEEAKKQKDELEYLFNWSRIWRKDKSRFSKFVLNILKRMNKNKSIKNINDIDLISIEKIRFENKNKNTIVADIIDQVDMIEVGKVIFEKNIIKSKGRISIDIGDTHNEIDLIMKQKDGGYYFYSKPKKTRNENNNSDN